MYRKDQAQIEAKTETQDRKQCSFTNLMSSLLPRVSLG